MDVQQGGADPDPGAGEAASGPSDDGGRRLAVIVAVGVLAVVALVAVVVLLLRDDGDDPVATTPTPTPTTPAPSPTTPSPSTPTTTATESPDAPGEPGLPGATLGPVSGGDAPGPDGTWIADVRSAGQDGFDRVVFEFTDVVPTYTVGYADPPFVATNDEEVDVAGAAFLQLRLEGTSAFNLDEGVPVYEGPSRVTSDTQVVTEVVDVDDFEGLVIWVIGLTEQQPLVVSELGDPARLVIDIEH